VSAVDVAAKADIQPEEKVCERGRETERQRETERADIQTHTRTCTLPFTHTVSCTCCLLVCMHGDATAVLRAGAARLQAQGPPPGRRHPRNGNLAVSPLSFSLSLSVCLCVCLSICLSVCLSICLSVFVPSWVLELNWKVTEEGIKFRNLIRSLTTLLVCSACVWPVSCLSVSVPS
jgi:hypothetical protein